MRLNLKYCLISACGCSFDFVVAVTVLFSMMGIGLVNPAAVWANDDAADSTNADELWDLGLTGAGVTVGVWEAFDGPFPTGRWEIRPTHEAFASYNTSTGNWDGPSRISFGNSRQDSGTGASSFSWHATHVAGTIGGAHIPGQRSSWGMAPNVEMVSFSSTNDGIEMTSNTQIDISNHSYGFNFSPWDAVDYDFDDGNGGTETLTYDRWSYNWDTTPKEPLYGTYISASRDIDTALVARPKLLSFFSAGNSRDDADDTYTDHQGDGRFVTQFSASYLANNTIVGEDLGGGWWLVSTSDYPLDPHGFDPGGYDSLSGDAVAKNNIVVGAANDFTNDPHEGNENGIVTTGFSSYGPTDDGRLGVDLVANGSGLRSAFDSSDTSYAISSGTSMSAPNAAGTAALVLEHWRTEANGYTPYSATQKGLLMHTSTDATRNGHVGPDYATGYGIMNGVEAVDHITESLTEPVTTRMRHYWEDTLDDGETLTFEFLAGGGDFKASLSWLDPVGDEWSGILDDRTPHLVNDLDLLLTDNLGNTYMTWVLDPDNPGDAATRDAHNRVDNFTQIYVDSFAEGTPLTLIIDHFGALSGGSQDFALFVTGGTIIPEPTTLALLAMGSLITLRRRHRRSWKPVQNEASTASA